MLKYFKEAFLVRARLPLLGGVPVNVLMAIAFGILGFAMPAFWLLGAGLIGAVVFMLATSPRFQKWVQAKEFSGRDRDTKALEATLVAQLPAASRQRLAELEVKHARVIAAYLRAEAESYTIESARDALARLRWMYLKLLVAHASLNGSDNDYQAGEVQRELEQLEKDLRSEKVSPAAKASRMATREILLKRVANVERRRHSIQEVESDLDRIEAQSDLALDDATLKGQPLTISGNIDLASQLLESGVYGASESLVLDLDRRLGTSNPTTPAPMPATAISAPVDPPPRTSPTGPPPLPMMTPTPPASESERA